MPDHNLDLLENIRIVAGIRDSEPVRPANIVCALTHNGWIFAGYLAVATSISSTGVTFTDTIWFKPNASPFTEMNNHSVVACTRARGLLFVITNVNTLANFSRRFVALAVKMHGIRFLEIKNAFNIEDDKIHFAIAQAVRKTMEAYPERFHPQWEVQRAFALEAKAFAYDAALATLNADLTRWQRTWDRLPMILVLRVLTRGNRRGPG